MMAQLRILSLAFCIRNKHNTGEIIIPLGLNIQLNVTVQLRGDEVKTNLI